MLSLLGLTVSIPLALAADPVVLYSDDSPDAARARVVLEGKLPADSLSVVAFKDFRSSLKSSWDGPGALVPCGGDAVDASQVDESIEKAEKALLYFKFEEATTALNTANAALPCLSSTVDGSTGARVGFLQGYVAIENEDQAAALEHFNASSRFQADLAWDDQYAAEGAPLLKTAQQIVWNTDPVIVSMGVAVTEADTLWIDGHIVPPGPPSDVPMIPGSHLIQVKNDEGVQGYTADVVASTTPTLVLPGLLPADGLAWVGDESGQARLSQLFSSVYEDGTPVFVTHREGLWRTEVGRPQWSELLAPSEKLAAPTPVPGMAWVGTGVTSALAAGTAVALAKALGAKAKIDAASGRVMTNSQTGNLTAAGTAYEEELALREARTAAWLGTGIGLGLTTVGVVITIPLFDGGAQ